MVNVRAAVLRIITCAVGGAVFLLVLRSFLPIESGPNALLWGFNARVWDYNSVYPVSAPPRPFWGVVGVGALLGLLPGIAWVIDQKSARRRFLVRSIMGMVVGFILSMAINRAEPMIVFSVAGMYVGSVSALNRLGVFEAEDQRSE